mgnify:CR=1 FL=1
MEKRRKTKIWFMNAGFILICGAILVFLLNAPEETTSALPTDEDHIKLHSIAGKKEAEKYCSSCHDTGKDAPLPEEHPPKYRCLFCHKRN